MMLDSLPATETPESVEELALSSGVLLAVASGAASVSFCRTKVEIVLRRLRISARSSSLLGFPVSS